MVVETAADGRWSVVVDGAEHLVDAHEIRPGTWSLLIDGRSHVVDLDARATGTTATSGHHERSILVEDARRKRLAEAVSGAGGAAARGEIVRAPIAGKVVKILVAAGDEVEAGQSVAVLEAMKMENEIHAERGGRVEAVHTSAGQSIDAGDKLLTLA